MFYPPVIVTDIVAPHAGSTGAFPVSRAEEARKRGVWSKGLGCPSRCIVRLAVLGRDRLVLRAREQLALKDFFVPQRLLPLRFERAQAHVAKLIQSLLAKAFRGERVPTEAEFARHEGSAYETEEALLERVKS